MANAVDQEDKEIEEQLSSSLPSALTLASSTQQRQENQNLNNPTPSQTFCHNVINLLNKDDVDTAIKMQHDMISRVERANAVIGNFNIVGKKQYEDFLPKFKEHTRLIMDMKKDLDNVYKRIRVLKRKIASQHKEAYEAAEYKINGEASFNEDIGE